MRVLILAIGLLLRCVVAPAQTLPTGYPTDSLSLQASPAAPLDSAAALHRMFAAKRAGRTLVMLGTGLTGGLTLALTSMLGSDKNNSLYDYVNQTRTVGFTLLAGVAELLYYDQYSREKEQIALLGLELHKLSPYLKRHLKPKYFLPPVPRP